MEKEFDMNWIKGMFASMMLCGCTLSVNMVHTEGTADNVIDETQSPTNDVKPELSVPISGI